MGYDDLFYYAVLFLYKPVKTSVIAGVIFSFAIEFSQLYQAPWINEVRHTLFGRLVLGEGFLWSDLLCYLVGIGMGLIIDLRINNQTIKGVDNKP